MTWHARNHTSEDPIAHEMFRLTEALYLCAVDFWDRYGESEDNNSMCYALSTLSSQWAETGLIVESRPWWLGDSGA